VLGGARVPHKETILGEISRPIVKYRPKEYPVYCQYSQPYSVGGSNSAAFRYLYCRNLLTLKLNRVASQLTLSQILRKLQPLAALYLV